MKNLASSLVVLISVFVASCAIALGADAHKQTEQLQKANKVLTEIMSTPDKGVPQELLNKAVCVGVVPSELKFAIGVGGTYGRGVLVCRRGGDGPWGAPSLFTLGGGSFGFQLGGEAKDVVFIVMNPEGARKLLQDKVKLGADATVAAGPVGRAGEAATDAQLHAEILSYSRARGLFAGVSLEGAILKQDNDENAKLYGRQIHAKDLVSGNVTPVPAGRALDHTLSQYSPKGGVHIERV
jgi:lipid-binding SYLF domain-containing protein